MDSSSPFATAHPRTVLTEREWQERAARHAARAEEFIRSAQRPEARPVESFLFTYYSYRPAQLRRWHPGPGVVLLGESARNVFRRWYRTTTVPGPSGDPVTGVGWTSRLSSPTGASGAVHRLLSAVRRAARTSAVSPCTVGDGLPAVPEERRHALPLRRCRGTDRVVSRIGSAARILTRSVLHGRARPLNQLQPTRESQIALDQPGCLHATMDCYKWAYKLSPTVPGELLLDCFALARDIRELDGAPPLRPVRPRVCRCYETPEGKAEFTAAQREFSERGQVLRDRLLAVIAMLGVERSPAAAS